MTQLSEKRNVLTQHDYSYDFDRMVYFNRDSRKAFSVEFLEDHTLDTIRRRIEEPSSNEWRIYFNVAPSASVREQLIGALEE